MPARSAEGEHGATAIGTGINSPFGYAEFPFRVQTPIARSAQIFDRRTIGVEAHVSDNWAGVKVPTRNTETTTPCFHHAYITLLSGTKAGSSRAKTDHTD